MYLNRILVPATIAILAGCGGSGGGSDKEENGPGNEWLQFAPSTIELTGYQGRELEFSVAAKSSKRITQQLNIQVIDPSGMVIPGARLHATSEYEFQASMKVSENLAAGTYRSTLEVRLCEDAPQTCAKPIDGSPWFVPIQVAVKPATNLTALSAQPGLGVWTTTGGNSRHTGYVPLRLDAAKFSQRWSYSYPPGSQMVPTRPVLQDGVAFMLVKYMLDNKLRAIDEASGKLLWEANLPESRCYLTPAALAAGKVFVGSSNCIFGSGSLLAYEQKTGQLLYNLKQGNFEGEAAPLAVGDALYTHGRSNVDRGNAHSISRIDPATGAIVWRTELDLYALQTLSADAEFLYVYGSQGGDLSILRQSNGSLAATSLQTSSCYSPGTPVLGTQGEVYAGCWVSGGAQQVAYDSIRQRAIWSTAVSTPQTPVLSGSTLYVINGNMVEARVPADGRVLWSANPQAGSLTALGTLQDLLVTDNLLFVSGGRGVAAIDLVSQKVVWTFPQGGPMAISSNGVLYLPGPVNGGADGTFPALVAVNLL
jgi:outer membrane protein assembly factor BamB